MFSHQTVLSAMDKLGISLAEASNEERKRYIFNECSKADFDFPQVGNVIAIHNICCHDMQRVCVCVCVVFRRCSLSMLQLCGRTLVCKLASRGPMSTSSLTLQLSESSRTLLSLKLYYC